MSEDGGLILPNFAVASDGMAGLTAVNIMQRGLRGQYRTEELKNLITERQFSIGQKPKLEKLQAKIDDLEMDHMTTANEAKRKELETQIQNLKLQKAQIEKKAKIALKNDYYLIQWNLEASRINQVNFVRNWGFGAVGKPDYKDVFSNIVAARDREASFRARQSLGAGGDGDDLTGAAFTAQSYSGGQHGQT